VSIRRAIPADLPRIHAIRNGVTENVLSDPSKVTAEEVAWYMEQAVFLVAEEAGEVVGFTCGNHQTGLIWALFIDPAHEGRGHGRALLDAALAGLEAAGLTQVHLNTSADTRAERFYRAHGWRDAGYDLDGQVVFVKALGFP
jgi:ribosomal protein S18 acetylase RimI-like enzyme